MNCAQSICSVGDADWYLDFTGWRGPMAAAVVASLLVAFAVYRWMRR